MNSQLDFILSHAVQYIQSNNLQSAILLLKQILQVKPSHPKALRMMAIAHAKKGLNIDALRFIDKAIAADTKDGVAHSNRGNILQNLGRDLEAVKSYHKSIQFAPGYAEAYGNLANALQRLRDYHGALKGYQDALTRDPINPDFYCNMGNCFLAMDRSEDAYSSYVKAIELQPNHADAHYFLAQLNFRNFNFISGWEGSEWRWLAREFNSLPIKISKPRWDGKYLSGSLLIWAEQGIGDQILYASMLAEVSKLTSSLTISVDRKLVRVFERSFPQCQILDSVEVQTDDGYDAQIPIGSIGKFFRRSVEDFKSAPRGYLAVNELNVKKFRNNSPFSQKIACGISWKSNNPTVGYEKSIALNDMLPIFELKDHFDFINLQYGDIGAEIDSIKNILDLNLLNTPNVDLFSNMEDFLDLVNACDVVVTTSNSTAHFAGAAGKETLLLLPYSAGRFWYWQEFKGKSLWYPSITIFRQQAQGDWSYPINKAKEYLEKRFGV